MSTTFQANNDEPYTPGTMLRSDSSQTYKIENILVDLRKPLQCVYRASAEGKFYIVKNMVPGEFEYQLDLQRRLSSCPNVRAVIDTIKEPELFIFPFLAGDLLRLSLKPLSADIFSIMANTKPNNIPVDYYECDESLVNIKAVQISDLEDTVIVPPGKWLRGPLCGNAIWRSPESWCQSRQNQASDVFSFGIVMVFRISDSQLKAEDSWRHILRRHISYFADEVSFNGFLQHIGRENVFFERSVALAGTFTPGQLRQPFETWDYVDPDLRDLVGKMTNLDPTRRITAREALQHRWFNRAI
ncbi:serine/threonine protein kinase [Trichophyton interdigitale MR816]|uniref:Serine/threonine protein kinase n=1 Tax=Trichophyton interdigitale (strain MR816) TaxID=1215338 RepID=A0A059J6L1_TRIIM|nr:serine/threonine protein kinase [Trichophyton interdigitale H6]KDB23439.1 serine/threonine protein kinase [Trichophyton interdigitale MR816]